MHKFFRRFIGEITEPVPALCLASVAYIGAGMVMSDRFLMIAGLGILIVVALVVIWRDVMRFPEVK